ncbi:MAG: hypothetical protein MJ158_03295 [Alphaproteobacteria bacterium]|nr:hypothetical protein [Alphaproteobacteria bacterium]
MKMTYFIFKSVPYILSVVGGGVVIWFSYKYIHSERLIDLMTNVSASLLSIPLVFLFYEYSNYRIQSRVSQYEKNKLYAEIKTLTNRILNQVRHVLGLKDINKFINDSLKYTNKINIKDKQITILENTAHRLEKILYKSERIQNLEVQQIQILSYLIQTLNETINEYKFHNNKKELAKYLATLVLCIDDLEQTIK